MSLSDGPWIPLPEREREPSTGGTDMPRPLTTASAEIHVARASATGTDLKLDCLVRSVIEPHAGPPSWPRQLTKAFREHLSELDIPAPQLTISDRDPAVVRLVW